MREPKTPMPLFYYSGSKKHGIKSDKTGIEFHLLRIPEHLREVACRQYEELYKKHLHGKFPNDRRSMANNWLLKYCDENGGSIDAMRKKAFGTKVSKENQEKTNSLVDRAKKAIKSNRKKIILD